MDIERHDGTKERREYQDPRMMMLAAAALALDPWTKKLTLHFPKPKLAIPRKRGRK
jgi:hypothetical protein